MKIKCSGIVHYPDGVVLVRDKGASEWRLPERQLDETEDVLLCIRRCVLMQTGYRIQKLRFYKVHTQARTAKQGALLHFIFGCEINGEPIQTAELESAHFSPNEITTLAAKGKFNDRILLDLLHRYHALVPPPSHGMHNPLT